MALAGKRGCLEVGGHGGTIEGGFRVLSSLAQRDVMVGAAS